MDDTAATAPSPSSAATTAAGYDVARDKTNADVAAVSVTANSGSGSSSGSGVRLLIKSSNQQYDDMNIESDLCWTVQRLKKQLSLVYPGKPEINDQKLIYSGKLLDDAQKLSEVIRSYKDVYQQHHIFHLVCANKNVSKTPFKTTTPPKDTTDTPQLDSAPIENELRQRHVAATAIAANAANVVNVASAQIPYQQPHLQQANAMYPWLHLQNQAFQMAAAEASATPAAAAAAASPSTTSHLAFQQQQQQQAFLYNAWVQQCYAVYMQQMMQRTSGTDSGPPPPMIQSLVQRFIMWPNNLSVPPLVGHQPVPVAAAVGAGAAGQPNEAAVAQQPAARPVDGPNFPNIQEEPEMRDWLDSFFSFTRLAIFVTVLYFNSSPMRCLLVVLIASVIYLYHIGVLRRRRERNNNNINRNNNAGDNVGAFAAVQQIQRMMDAAVERDNNPQAAAEPVPAADQDDAAGAAEPATAGADQADAAAAAAEAVIVEPANANNSVISIVRTYVVTFFTSLLPEAPAL